MSSPSIKSTFSQAQSVGAFASPTGVKVPRPYARKEVLVEKTGIAPADPSPIGEKTGKSKIFTRSEQDASLYPAGHWVANHTRKFSTSLCANQSRNARRCEQMHLPTNKSSSIKNALARPLHGPRPGGWHKGWHRHRHRHRHSLWDRVRILCSCYRLTRQI